LRSRHPLPSPGEAKAPCEARAKTKSNARAWRNLSNHFDKLFARRMKLLMLLFDARIGGTTLIVVMAGHSRSKNGVACARL
jgi:hypothetical protein